MTRLLALVLTTTLLYAAPAASSATPAAPDEPTSQEGRPSAHRTAADPGTVTLGGVTVRLRRHTKQVVTANRTTGYHARVVLWALREGEWTRVLTARDGRIGYNGLVRPKRRVQGSGKTPLGTFRLPWAFGTGPQRDTWDPSYRRARKGDYWVLDNDSLHYNRWRHRSQGGFRWWLGASHPDASERLRDYPRQYRFAVTTSFNQAQVRHRGGAIFLHVNGDGATAGCVSAPRWLLRRTLNRLDTDKVPLIAIGR